MLWHWNRSVWWCERKLMLRLWNHKTKTATVTWNLVLELKYMILSIKNKKTDSNLPGQAGHWDLHLPDQVSYLPQAVGQSVSYPVFWSIQCVCVWQAPSISSKSHGDELEDGDMDTAKMMFDWGLTDQYPPPPEQVEGESSLHYNTLSHLPFWLSTWSVISCCLAQRAWLL